MTKEYHDISPHSADNAMMVAILWSVQNQLITVSLWFHTEKNCFDLFK